MEHRQKIGTMYPFPEEVLDKEFGRLKAKYGGTPHHRNWWRKANNKTRNQTTTRNRYLKSIWDEYPGEFEALKARWRLGVA